MTKSLEVTIALLILFAFLFFTIESHNPSTNTKISVNSKIKDIIDIKTQNSEFRELVTNSNLNGIYDSLYPFIDTEYTIEICEYINTNCVYKDTINYDEITTHSYYFSDSNKTLNLIFWIE